MLRLALIITGGLLAYLEFFAPKTKKEVKKGERSNKSGNDRTTGNRTRRKRADGKGNHRRRGLKNDGNIQQSEPDDPGNSVSNNSVSQSDADAQEHGKAERLKARLIAKSKKKVKAILAKRKEKETNDD